VDEGDVRAIDKAITQQEIADRIGATREMVNHVIRELVRGGFLIRDRDRRMVLAKNCRSTGERGAMQRRCRLRIIHARITLRA
jgi:DNA-binding MarR family transcriptional regulator